MGGERRNDWSQKPEVSLYCSFELGGNIVFGGDVSFYFYCNEMVREQSRPGRICSGMQPVKRRVHYCDGGNMRTRDSPIMTRHAPTTNRRQTFR